MLHPHYEIIPILALKDNYIWMLINHQQRSALIIDPGDANPVITYLNQHQITLAGIMLTHHHGDHTHGVDELLQFKTVPVFASSQSPIPAVTHYLQDGDVLCVSEDFPKFLSCAIPGHTLDHMAYYGEDILFCGDTLFGAGCGRLFEGTATQLYTSLKKLTALPPQTKIYCGHEYTADNLRFAQRVEPGNQAINDRILAVNTKRRQQLPSLPSLLSDEIKTNPFLRCDSPVLIEQVEQHSQTKLLSPVEVFAALRQWKNDF